MCGIAGITYSALNDKEQTISAVARMMDVQKHRGPDDSGLYAGDRVVLGHRRLAVIDLSQSGRQPISNENGTVWVVFNGEIYNYRELRNELVNCGHVFKSRSDSEVLVHGFEEWGIDELLRRLIGMFAFAICQVISAPKNGSVVKNCVQNSNSDFTIILARDRLGKKPIYYGWKGEQLIFASEVRALMASGFLSNKISHTAIDAFLMFGSMPSTSTMIQGIQALDAGHYMVVKNGTSTLHRYWNLPFQNTPYPDHGDLLKEFQQLLEDSISLRLVSDVSLGVFLSGGIDSSAIVALMSKVSEKRIKTFSLSFKESKYDEGNLAKLVASRFQTQHHDFKVSPIEVLKELPRFFDSMDQPTIDGLNTYLISQVTRDAGTIVALSGVGGDELFGGYPSFRLAPRLLQLSRLAHDFPLIRKIMNAVLPQYLTKGKTEKLRALLEEQPSLEAAYLSVRGLFLRKELSYNDTSQSPMKIPNEISTSLNYLRNLVNSCAESHSFNKISCLEIRSYLQNQLLRDTDVMGMAHALEIRAPFLDHRVVEFMAQVPVSLKTGKLPKAFLLRAIDGNLPNESFKNPKRGFALPFDMWFKHEWKNYIKITLLENSLEIDNLNWQPAHTWQQFLNGKIHWSRIWAIIVLTEWLKRFSCQDTTLANKF